MLKLNLVTGIVLAAALCVSTASADAVDCDGTVTGGKAKTGPVLVLDDGGVARYGKMNINMDGSDRAYHPLNKAGGAVIHLCNAGDVYLPDGTHYHGSESNEICTGRFMVDYKRIKAAGWKDPDVGAINWYGIYGTGSVTVGGHKVTNVEPQLLPSGFYKSATALEDKRFSDRDDQRRWLDALTVPAAVIPDGTQLLGSQGVIMGTAGVAVRKDVGIAVPFIVGDAGPRIGEGTPALARLAAGRQIDPNLNYDKRFVGIVDDRNVLWVFFGGNVKSPPYDGESVMKWAAAQYKAWGGDRRLQACLGRVDIPGR